MFSHSLRLNTFPRTVHEKKLWKQRKSDSVCRIFFSLCFFLKIFLVPGVGGGQLWLFFVVGGRGAIIWRTSPSLFRHHSLFPVTRWGLCSLSLSSFFACPFLRRREEEGRESNRWCRIPSSSFYTVSEFELGLVASAFLFPGGGQDVGGKQLRYVAEGCLLLRSRGGPGICWCVRPSPHSFSASTPPPPPPFLLTNFAAISFNTGCTREEGAGVWSKFIVFSGFWL